MIIRFVDMYHPTMLRFEQIILTDYCRVITYNFIRYLILKIVPTELFL